MESVYLGQLCYTPVVVQKRGLIVTPYELSEDVFYMMMQIFRDEL